MRVVHYVVTKYDGGDICLPPPFKMSSFATADTRTAALITDSSVLSRIPWTRGQLKHGVPIYLPDYAGAKLPKYSAFAVEDPRAWKSLPPALRSTSKSFSSFKKLKSFLFGFSFWSWQREYWLC